MASKHIAQAHKPTRTAARTKTRTDTRPYLIAVDFQDCEAVCRPLHKAAIAGRHGVGVTDGHPGAPSSYPDHHLVGIVLVPRLADPPIQHRHRHTQRDTHRVTIPAESH